MSELTGDKKNVLKQFQLNKCPNPKCKTPFEKPITIYDKSKKPVEKFYGCPHCFFKIDITETFLPKESENQLELKESRCFTPSEEEKISNCPNYFGYLADYYSIAIIPIECLDCEKMKDCMKC